MRNRAKCKCCQEIIESFHEHDLVYCKCKQIGINGGLVKYWTYAEDYKNFLRIGNDDEEIEVTVKERGDVVEQKKETIPEPTYSVMDQVDHMIKSIEDLPEHAKLMSCTQYDFLSILYILKAFIKS